jgi:hypothetical protein
MSPLEIVENPYAPPALAEFQQTKGGRYLFTVVIAFPDGKAYPVTARPMTDKEKSRYRKRKNQ